jgi:hypothetical protein
MIEFNHVSRLAARIHVQALSGVEGEDCARSVSSRPGLLDVRLPLALRIVILMAACLIPTCYVLKHYDSNTKFTRLIYFGANFQDSALPEVKELGPAVESSNGYDAQFYAQMAIDPLLKNPQLKRALDNPGFRAQRILLPMFAYLAGLGKPSAIVDIYALLNLFFWLLLLFGLVHYLRASTTRDYLCIFAAVFTTGALISVQRALTDLPAATLGFYACALSGASAWVMLSLAILMRQTSLMFLARFVWPLPKDRAEVLALALRVVLVITPFGLWLIYIHHVFGPGVESPGHFGWPFRDWVLFVHAKWQALRATPLELNSGSVNLWEWRLFELLAPLSVTVQVCSFAIWRSPRCPYWRMGVGFAVMFIFLTSHVFIEQIEYCRIVLPMTIAFNIGLMRQKGSVFSFNFIAGNVGLVWAFQDTLSYCLFR